MSKSRGELDGLERAPAGQLELQARKEHRLAQQACNRRPVVELPELLHAKYRWHRLRARENRGEEKSIDCDASRRAVCLPGCCC